MLFVILLNIFQQHFTNCNDCPTDYFQHRYYGNKCYYIHNVTMNWYQAFNFCSDTTGADLANIYNRNVHDDIVKRLSDKSKKYHFGLHEHAAGQLVWSFGGEFATNTSWYIWHTNYASFNLAYLSCAYYIYDGKYWRWGLDQCTELNYPICEYTIPSTSADHEIALVDGDGELSGRVEIYKDNMWGTIMQTSGLVTDDFLGPIVCAYFGLQFLRWATVSTIRDGTGRIWLNDLDCKYGDTLIDECIQSSESWSYNNIPEYHAKDIRLKCTYSISKSTNIYASVIETTLQESQATTTLECPVTLCGAATSTVTTTDYVTFTETSTIAVTKTLTPTILTTSKIASIIPSKALTSIVSGISPTTASTIQISDDVKPSAMPATASVKKTSAKTYKKKDSPLYSTMTRYDNRPSAVAIGSFGLVIFLSVISLAIFLDILTIKKEPLLRDQSKIENDTRYDICDENEHGAQKLDSESILASPNSIDLFCIPPRAEYNPSTLENYISDTIFPDNKYVIESPGITETASDTQFVSKFLEVPTTDPNLTICGPHTSVSSMSPASSCRSLCSVSIDSLSKPNISENSSTPYLIDVPHTSYYVIDDIAFPPTPRALYGFSSSETDTD